MRFLRTLTQILLHSEVSVFILNYLFLLICCDFLNANKSLYIGETEVPAEAGQGQWEDGEESGHRVSKPQTIAMASTENN